MREWLAEVFARPRLEPSPDVIIPPRRSEDSSISGSALTGIGNTPAFTMSSVTPTPQEFVSQYIAGRLVTGQEYSGRGAQRERDLRKLDGKRGFGNTALSNLVASERKRRGHPQNRGGKGSAG
jgi:hypothetical protein